MGHAVGQGTLERTVFLVPRIPLGSRKGKRGPLSALLISKRSRKLMAGILRRGGASNTPSKAKYTRKHYPREIFAWRSFLSTGSTQCQRNILICSDEACGVFLQVKAKISDAEWRPSADPSATLAAYGGTNL